MAQLTIPQETLSVAGRKVHCRVIRPETSAAEAASPGLPLLLIHGLGCTGEVWDPTLRCLARSGVDQPALAPDMPGYGASPGPREALGINDLADWAARLLEARNYPRVHVAGNSVGCQVALALARRHPARVGKLVLVGPTTGTRYVSTARYVLGLLLDALLEPMLYNGTLLRMYWQMGTRRFLATSIKMLRHDVFAYTGEITAPCLIVRGDRDAIVPEAVARRLASALPQGTYTRIAGSAHAAQFNKPQIFTRLLREFLRGVPDAWQIPAGHQESTIAFQW